MYGHRETKTRRFASLHPHGEFTVNFVPLGTAETTPMSVMVDREHCASTNSYASAAVYSQPPRNGECHAKW